MPDRGRPIEFGVFLIPNADEYPELVEQAERTDRIGLDYIGIQDHPHQRRFLRHVRAPAGAAVVVIGNLLQLPSPAVTIAGAALCFGLRLAAIRRGWQLPIAGPPERLSDSAAKE